MSMDDKITAWERSHRRMARALVQVVLGGYALLVAVALCVAALALTGCASQIERVEIPVALPCVSEIPEPPRFAVDGLPIGADAATQHRYLRADRVQRKAYEAELTATLEGCR